MVATVDDAPRTKLRQDQKGTVPVPADLPPGTRGEIVGVDETPLVGNERERLPHPITYRSITHPNLKLMGKIVYKPHPFNPKQHMRYWLPKIEFYESYLTVEYKDENERVLNSRYASQFFVEPTRPDGQPWEKNDPAAPVLMQWKDATGRVRFATRNPRAYQAFELRMRT